MGRLHFFAVLTSVNLHNQPGWQTDEVGKVRSNGKLSSEAQTIDSFPSQHFPELGFCLGPVGAQLA